MDAPGVATGTVPGSSVVTDLLVTPQSYYLTVNERVHRSFVPLSSP